ncbi:MAG: CBS domain-containing protein [Alphaproteobacteria bacterium]|nr:CBS domain-containing protein [Alphaproteobacteria bacterium]
MALHTTFPPDRLLLQASFSSTDQLVEALARTILSAEGMPQLSHDELMAAIAERRDDGWTRLAQHFVAVHLRLPDVSGVRMAFATLAEPMRWVDDGNLRWCALLVAPRERPVQEVRLLHELGELCKDPAKRAWISAARDPEVLAPWIDARLREPEGPITARDLMRPSMGILRPDTPVPELVRRMASMNVDAVGLTDPDRKLLGQVTAADLFTLGMPDFFRQLRSVAFIPEFDPFERYFAKEAKLVAADVMSQDYAALPPDATVLEVVFALAVQGHPKVYVVEDGRLIGVIDRIRVLDRILSP